MPKFKMVNIHKDKFVDGKLVQGLSVAVPLDDAAKAHPIVDMAIDSGQYVPSSPNERETLERKQKEMAYKDMRKKGKIDDNQLKAALNSLK